MGMKSGKVTIISRRSRGFLKKLRRELERAGLTVHSLIQPIIPLNKELKAGRWEHVAQSNAVLIVGFSHTVTQAIRNIICQYDVPTLVMTHRISKVYQISSALDIGMRIPDSLFFRAAIIQKKRYEQIVEKLGTPFVLKREYGARGDDVYLVTNEQEFTTYLEKGQGVWIGQRYCKHTRDIRLFILDNAVLSAFERIRSYGDFRTNTARGGTIRYLSSREVPQAKRDQSIAIIKHLGHTFGVVDWIYDTETNEYVFMEVNANPSFPRHTQSHHVIAEIANYLKSL